MEDLGEPLPTGKYPLIDCLVKSGIRGLLELARADYGYQTEKITWLNHCDLCTDIRHFLCQKDGKRFPELSPSGFYDES